MKTTTVGWTIDQLRDIVASGDHETIDWADASAVVALYDAMPPRDRSKLLALPLTTAVTLAWRIIRQGAPRPQRRRTGRDKGDTSMTMDVQIQYHASDNAWAAG